jgi:DUF2075 family protein
MNRRFELSVEISEPYAFNKESLAELDHNTWVKAQWPLVYIIRNESNKILYIGESTNAASRIRNHLANEKKRDALDQVSIIGSDKFNKSATLDIEGKLIAYFIGDGTYKLMNGNYGLINHRYYQQDLYHDLFVEIWTKLSEQKIVTKSLTEIQNSELFKYSPYKSLNVDQYASVLEILGALTTGENRQIFVSGTAGTGKTVLATYLVRLLTTVLSFENQNELNADDLKEINFIRKFQGKYPAAKIGLVIAMTSLRESLKTVFDQIPGLKSAMVLSPSDTFKLGLQYDLLIVDEAHRLRRYKNISWMGVFRKNNRRLGLSDDGTELDWILANSKNQIFFYDAAQSVKPSDVDGGTFADLIDRTSTLKLTLKSQMRVQGGRDYISFVDDLLNVKRRNKTRFAASNYDLFVFDSLREMYDQLGMKERRWDLCRLIAGYSWPWLSKKDPTAMDIDIEGLQFQWNQTDEDWIYSKNAFKQIGCIHTTQGYDLNYTGIIFGREIDYNARTKEIEINPKLYFDINGKKGIDDPVELKAFILNVYKTIMYRGIRGTYIYACNAGLRKYLKENIESFADNLPFRILCADEIKPYVNSVPLVDISVAAGEFSPLQQSRELQWIELPFHISSKAGHFVCKVVGESMNKTITNGSYCLFSVDEGGSRDGKIVLVQSTSVQDADFGAGYTVKRYFSEKLPGDGRSTNTKICLRPESDDLSFHDIELSENELEDFKVVGVFKRVI